MSSPEAPETLEISGPDGVVLHTHIWSPTGEPKGLVAFIHGLGEHSARYDAFARLLCEDGWLVCGHDHRGHGLSGGVRGHVDGFDTYSRDIDAVLAQVAGRLADDAPLFILGHSMGGLIVLSHQLVDGGRQATGMVLSNPLLKVAVEAPRLKILAGRLLSRILPKLRLDNEVDPNLISRDADEVKKYVEDPLVHGKISTRWFTSMTAAKDAVHAAAATLTTPSLWIVSGGDRIVHPDGATRFLTNAGASNATRFDLPDALHEAHNGPERDRVHGAVREWLAAQ